MKFKSFVLIALALSTCHLAYASLRINLEVENQTYEETTSLFGRITYLNKSKEAFDFEKTIPPKQNENSKKTVSVPCNGLRNVTLLLLKENAPKDSTALALGNHEFQICNISELKAQIHDRDIFIESKGNLPPLFNESKALN